MTRPILTLLLALLSFGASSCGAAPAAREAAVERDLWYSIGDGETRYGWLRTRVRALEGGGLEFRSDSHVELELFGAPQDQRAEVLAVVDAELHPQRLEARSEQRSGTQVVRGRADGSGLVVEVDGGATRAVGERGALVLDLALGDYLHRRRAEWTPEVAPRSVALLTAQTGTVANVRVRRAPGSGGGSRWELRFEGQATSSWLELDEEGRLLSQRTSAPALLVQRVDAAEATSIERHRIPDRELLVFAPPEPLPPAHRLASVTVRLRWEDIALEELELEDARQRLVSHVQEGARHEALLELRRPAELATDATLPVTEARFAAALAETELLRPRDARIAARAQELLGEERSALAAARRASAWVSANVEPLMIAETLSGPEVLERGVGKCTEMTTLFGSLARAVGLPTRIALGLRRFPGESGDSWGGHMWNEVWIGEWIPVDAGADEVGGSPALLKLVASNTVAGTQRVRWLLTESLELEVVGHELLPAANDWTTGLDGGIYTDAEEGLRFELPAAGWSVVPVEAPGAATLRLEPPAGSAAKVHLVAFALPAAVAPRAILAARQEAQAAELEDVEVTEDRPQRVGALEGHRLRFEGRLRAKAGAPLRVTELLWTAPGRGFLLNLIASPEEHDALAPALDSICASFELAAR